MLKAFTAGLLLIMLSELGDKTFFIAMILAMRHSRRLVYIGVVTALAAMTILSVFVGQIISLLPQSYIHDGEVLVFLGFGIKLLYDASQMPNDSCEEEVKEASLVVEQAEKELPAKATSLAIVLEAFGLTFIAEWGDRTQIATIALAASNNPYAVTVGAILGHAICAVIAVVGGRMIAGRISERIITAIGGSLFIVFGAIALLD